MATYKVRQRAHEDLVDDLLAARGIDAAQKDIFLNPDFVRDSHDPFLLPDMDAAVERIVSAQKNGERVCVWSDYDCDGIPGGVMLVEFLRAAGLTTSHYIPHRHKEGYGLNTEGISELAGQGVKLIITIDLGTTEHEAIAFANTKGVDVIVTDHHLVSAGEVLPPALAVINPKRPDSRYPFADLCGAGVAWKLVQAILLKNRPGNFPVGQEKWFLDLVGIATLSDMVPLVGENRMLARNGLLVMRRARRPGIAALLKLLRISAATLTEDDVTFMLSPRLNAASRMDTPQTAAALLAATDAVRAHELAGELNRINDTRKVLVASTVKEANKRLKEAETKSPLIVMGSPAWRPGILGLVAGKLAEAHGKTTFLWGREGGEELRGSCRSAGEVNVVDLMAKAGNVFSNFGGHAASGGFSVDEEHVHELASRLAAAHQELAGASKTLEVTLDREMGLEEVPHAHRDIKKLFPFGVGFAKPLFMLPQVSVDSMRMFGKGQDHLELLLSRGGQRVSGIAFFSTPESFTKKVAAGGSADIVGHVEADWRGNPRLRIVDLI